MHAGRDTLHTANGARDAEAASSIDTSIDAEATVGKRLVILTAHPALGFRVTSELRVEVAARQCVD